MTWLLLLWLAAAFAYGTAQGCLWSQTIDRQRGYLGKPPMGITQRSAFYGWQILRACALVPVLPALAVIILAMAWLSRNRNSKGG